MKQVGYEDNLRHVGLGVSLVQTKPVGLTRDKTFLRVSNVDTW